MIITQAERILSIETPLAYDVLLLGAIEGVEALSRPFQYHVQLLAEIASGSPAQVAPERLIGNEVAIAIQLVNEERRYIHGIVKNFTTGGQDSRFAYYRADIVPWLDLLKLSSNCRFFQKKTVPEIVEKVFQDLNYRAYR